MVTVPSTHCIPSLREKKSSSCCYNYPPSLSLSLTHRLWGTLGPRAWLFHGCLSALQLTIIIINCWHCVVGIATQWVEYSLGSKILDSNRMDPAGTGCGYHQSTGGCREATQRKAKALFCADAGKAVISVHWQEGRKTAEAFSSWCWVE